MMRRHSQVRGLLGAILLFGFGVLFVNVASAQVKFREEAALSRESAALIETLVAAPDSETFRKLAARAHAVGIFPVVKEQTAFFLQSATGDGVISARTRDGWTAPAFYRIGSIKSRGIFVKGGKFAVVVLFMKEDAIPACGKENITLRDSSSNRTNQIVTRPDAAAAELDRAAIVVFANLNGSLQATAPKTKDWSDYTLNDQDKLNKRLYGISTCAVLAGKQVKPVPAGILDFRDSLQKRFPAAGASR